MQARFVFSQTVLIQDWCDGLSNECTGGTSTRAEKSHGFCAIKNLIVCKSLLLFVAVVAVVVVALASRHEVFDVQIEYPFACFISLHQTPEVEKDARSVVRKMANLCFAIGSFVALGLLFCRGVAVEPMP